MSVLDRFVAARELATNVPISISTGLAIESGLGIHPEIQVTSPPLLEVKTLVINVRTLIRNILSTMTTDGKRLVTEHNLIPALLEEMSIIESALSKHLNGKVNVVYYVCSYRSMRQMFPHALLKVPNTELQKFYHVLENNLLRNLKEMSHMHDIRYFDVTLTGKWPECFIITHMVVDLLSAGNFAKLSLLESHTGAIKKHLLWNTKLTNGKELDNMPFNKFTLQVFGDNGVHFSPLSPKVKNTVKAIAEKYKWTSFTTRDKILYGINEVEDKVIRATLKDLI